MYRPILGLNNSIVICKGSIALNPFYTFLQL